MTEKAEQLVQVMEQMEALETTIAINNLVAAGVVTDPEVIRDSAAAASALLTMQLAGIRLLLEPSTSKAMMHGMTQILKD